jgi:hypothetical protein
MDVLVCCQLQVQLLSTSVRQTAEFYNGVVFNSTPLRQSDAEFHNTLSEKTTGKWLKKCFRGCAFVSGNGIRL